MQTAVDMAEDEKQYRRLYPRRKVYVPCRLAWQEHQAAGRTIDVSFEGLAILLRGPIALIQEGEGVVIRVHIPEEIVLRARPVHMQQLAEASRVGFKIVLIESGAQQWETFCYVPRW